LWQPRLECAEDIECIYTDLPVGGGCGAGAVGSWSVCLLGLSTVPWQGSRGSVVRSDWATGWTYGGFNSCWSKGFSKISRPAVGPSLLLTGYWRTLQVVKWPGREVDYSLAEVKNERSYTSSPPYAFMAWTGTSLPCRLPCHERRMWSELLKLGTRWRWMARALYS
jgi:hypothetical protein